jgi:hypothetical protein
LPHQIKKEKEKKKKKRKRKRKKKKSMKPPFYGKYLLQGGSEFGAVSG